ncbi:MAG: hypothetical protein JWP50_1339 [Phenylobacterium sp.]|nr:hypothetical protein [Phenylobacterium sp.]
MLMAIGLRGTIPAGWMPNTQGLLNAPLVICTATGSQVIAAHDPKGHAPAPPRQQHDHCAFAGLGSAPPPAPIGLPAPFALADIAVADRPGAAAPVAARGHREQAPRAPPTLV